jgi:predicted nucleotidyltransferase
VRRILAFGSRVRGDAEPDSDLDVAVLLDEPSEELEGRLRDAAYEVMWDRDFAPVISLKFFEETRFDALARKGYSFFRSVVEEGVVL